MHTCSEDPSAEQVITLGRAEGWARCPGCAQMIELNMGCYHMTCRCRTEFCYLCRARWKTCTCPQWDEHRLLAVAERRVDARPRQPPLPVRPIIRPRQPLRPPATAPLVPRPVPALQPAAATPAPQPAAARTAAVPAVPAPVPAPQTARAGPARATATTVSAQQQQDSARQRMIRELMDHLRIDHECAHNNWSYRRGGGECENCHQHLPHYLFVSDRFMNWRADHGLPTSSVVNNVRCWCAIAVGGTASNHNLGLTCLCVVHHSVSIQMHR